MKNSGVSVVIFDLQVILYLFSFATSCSSSTSLLSLYLTILSSRIGRFIIHENLLFPIINCDWLNLLLWYYVLGWLNFFRSCYKHIVRFVMVENHSKKYHFTRRAMYFIQIKTIQLFTKIFTLGWLNFFSSSFWHIIAIYSQ